MPPALRALVVDDSRAMRRRLVSALRKLGGVALDEAADGLEAMKKLSTSRFDLVVTDINMPVMDGLKLIRHVRSTQGTSSVPIVVVTTVSAEADRQRALELGANVYLVKPVEAREVLDAVKPLLPAPRVE